MKMNGVATKRIRIIQWLGRTNFLIFFYELFGSQQQLLQMKGLLTLSSIKKFGHASRLALVIVFILAVIHTLSIFIFLSTLIALMTLALGSGG